MTKCFEKFFWRIFWRFLVMCWFSRFFALKVFSKFFSGNREHEVYGGFWAFFCSGCLSLAFPLEFRYISVLPPMILPLFFDQSSIDLRLPNGEWTENERRMNENRSKNDRRTIEEQSRTDREQNENRTRTEREQNENRTRTERRIIQKIYNN